MILFLLSNFLMLLMLVSFVWEFLAWREVFTGHIALDSLRLLTGIVDKMKLIKIFGSHDQDMVFSASFWQIVKARPWIRWIFVNKVIELFLFTLLWRLTWRGAGQGWRDFLIVIAYYLFAYLLYRAQVKKVHYQLVHEKLKKYGPKLETGFRFDHLGSNKNNADKASSKQDEREI